MIDDLDKTIEKLLRQELKINNGQIDIKFDQPKREWSTRLNKPTVNFYLYDVRENPILRESQWNRLPDVTNGNGERKARLKRSPFRIDCFYVLTTWAADPKDEHRLLARCLNALLRHPILPEGQLEGQLKEPSYEIQARLARHDQLTNPAELWGSLDNEIRPSLPYVVTLTFDPWEEREESIAQTFSQRFGRINNYSDDPAPEPESIIIALSGTVRNKETKAPIAGVEVNLKGTARAATTDSLGRFRLGGMIPGPYTLVATTSEGTQVEREITLTEDRSDTPPGGYDLEL